MVSGVPASSSATAAPQARSWATTAWTTSSGAEAPAVTPMARAPSNQLLFVQSFRRFWERSLPDGSSFALPY